MKSAPMETKHAAGRYLDGQQPIPHEVQVTLDPRNEKLVITKANTVVSIWTLAEVRRLAGIADNRIILHHTDTPEARLELLEQDRNDPEGALGTWPIATAKAPPPARSIWIMAGTALCSIGAMIFLLIPLLATQLAVLLPTAGERALGDAVLGQIRSALSPHETLPLANCNHAPGWVALEQMEMRLRNGTPNAPPIRLTVLDHPMINAFALPGGHVVLFDGLLQEATAPEQVAAVLAHEIGHVAARDPTRIALQTTGTLGIVGLFFGDFAGGAAVLFLVKQLISAKYTQTAETNADTYAHEMLLSARVPPSAIADFFHLFDGQENHVDGTFFEHFLSHPAMVDRISRAEAATPEQMQYSPVLSPDQWSALQRICQQ